MQERLPSEHDSELLSHPLPRLLDCGGVANEDARHLQSLGRHVTDGCLEVVGDPLNKVTRVLVHNVHHLIVNFLGRHAPAEHHGAGEVPPMAGVGGAHHVLGVKRLSGELRDRQNAVFLGSASREGGEPNEEEVKTREGDHVHGQLAQIAVELPGEAEGARGASDGVGNQVVKVAVGRIGKLERAKADVIERLIVEGKALVSILHELMN
mmetsp:Transcript_36260/g.108739  ORF Transcript_36260/g.108739 Transcript_36260/m.108739 type:complete len:209 (-) Transcript_36260:708-1334(-)